MTAATAVRDGQTMRELHHQHHHRLVGFLTRMTGSYQTGEDLAQETWMRILLDHRPLVPADAWPLIYVIAKRLGIDWARRRKSRPVEVGGDTTEWLTAADDIQHTLDRLQIAETLSHLSPQQRQALTDVYLHDMTVTQYAALRGIAMGTAKTRLFYGLRASRSVLEAAGEATHAG
jgi:RNA polymerase sigma-70 factor, ECF subfamily